MSDDKNKDVEDLNETDLDGVSGGLAAESLSKGKTVLATATKTATATNTATNTATIPGSVVDSTRIGSIKTSR